jgi:hypothetical protein
MLQDTLPPGHDNSTLQDLATEYMEYHADITNYTEVLAIEIRLLRRLGIDPHHRAWQFGIAIMSFLVVLAPALALNAIPGQQAEAPLLTWLALALFMSIALATVSPMFASAARNHLTWVHALVDEEDLRRLLKWQWRWFSSRVITPASLIPAALSSLLAFWLIGQTGAEAPLGSLYIGFFAMAMLFQNAVCMVLVVFEARELAKSRHELFRLGPAYSVIVRQTVRGYTQLGSINIVLFTPAILGLLLLLPVGSPLIVPTVIVLLLFEFTYTGLAALAPRAILGTVIRRAKDQEMRRLQSCLDEFMSRITNLNRDEIEEMKLLMLSHDSIRGSSDSLLPLAAVLRTSGALLLSSITVVITAFAQRWIATVMAGFSR